MTTRKIKEQPGEPEGSGRGRAFYVYCIGASSDLAPLFEGDLPGAIESTGTIALVESNGLAAIVSAVPLADYGEDALQSRLADATWTAARAMRHERVVEHFARRAAVVPLRFGTIYLRPERVKEMLSEREAELRALVSQLEGRDEWGVNVYRDGKRLIEVIAAISPRLKLLTQRAAEARPGQAYLLQKQIDALRVEEARVETARVVAELERELSAIGGRSAALRVLKDEATEHGETVAKLAFLIPRERFDEFRAAAERLAAEHADSGFKLEMTGPWPAYNFAK